MSDIRFSWELVQVVELQHLTTPVVDLKHGVDHAMRPERNGSYT
jgi:hypothetical protein